MDEAYSLTAARYIELNPVRANIVVIEGLIDESTTKTQTKIPCLGDVPLLGWGFKSESKGVDKTNLYVFIKPKVIQNPLEAAKIYKEKKSEIESIEKGDINLYNHRKLNNPIQPVITEPFLTTEPCIEPLITEP